MYGMQGQASYFSDIVQLGLPLKVQYTVYLGIVRVIKLLPVLVSSTFTNKI